jgi:hypothetical protein
MTEEQRALRDAYLAELWPVCREVPREERAAEKAAAECAQVVHERWRKEAS